MDKVRFLMSDTSADVTAACREALEQKGVEVTVVEKDGLQILQKMLVVRPQVVLLDAFMPGLDALAVKQKYVAAGETHTTFFVTGPAEIWATIEGEAPRAYRIQIERVSDADPRRNLVIRVTDPSLLSATGGIVQGMSGSPILQNGRLVGAVTHVLVNDPTRGYGIFAQTMP